MNTKSIKLNTLLIAIARVGSIVCNLCVVPISLNYLDKTYYGVWLTLTSIISWLSFMDAGLGNGLRNKLAEALTDDNKKLAKEYVSTSYILFSIIIACFLVFFSLVNPLLPWNIILKTNLPFNSILFLTYIVVFSFAIRLVLDLASIVVIALHKPFIKAFIDFLFNLITLIFVLLLSHSKQKSFLMFGSVVSLVPVIILIIFTLFLFNKRSKYAYLSPSIKYFKIAQSRSLLSLGIQFFVVQLAAIIIFSTDNIIITQYFLPAEVTSFNVVYKYFSVITTGFMIVLMPYWSSFTSAFFSGKIDWIKKSFKNLILIWVLQVVASFIFLLSATHVYRYWLGSGVKIDNRISVGMCIYVVIYNWNNLFVYFLNGVSKIKLQLYSAVFVGIINIPLSIALAKYTSYGVSAILIANCLCLLICSLWAPIQCYKIIKGTAKGIWNK